MTNIIRIFLADDHSLVRSGFRAILSRLDDFEIVGEAADGHAVLTEVEKLAPDVVVLDISLPGINGLEIIPRIKKTCPSSEVVILSMHQAEEYVLRAYQNGALSYLTKDAPTEDLVAAIRSAAMKKKYFPQAINQDDLDQQMKKSGSGRAERWERLTPREREVLQLLAEGRSTQAIALKMGVSPKTVESHRAHLSAKLGLYDIASLTRYAIQRGLISAD